MVRTLIALLVLLTLIGCGGGGGGTGNVNFTVNTKFPAFDANSANGLARSRSAWIFITTTGGNRVWADRVDRPSDSGGDVLRRVDIGTNASVNVEIRGFSGVDGTGSPTGVLILPNRPTGSDIVVTSLNLLED
jgi:hypothetical protein